MSDLPKGWATATLNDLLGTDGLFSDGDWIESKDQDPNGTNRLLQLADIGDGLFVDKSSRYVNDEKFSSLSCTELKDGDVLIARMPAPLGRACLLPTMPQRCLTVVDVAVFRVGNTGVSNKWLMHFLNSSTVRRQMEMKSSGTTRKRISRGKLGEILLSIPPITEQTRIATKLDELLAQVDTLKARIDGIPALLNRFRQSIFAVAVSGKLTEKWRSSHDTSKPLESWKSCKIGEISSLVTSGSRGWADYYSDSGAIFIRSQDINTDELEISDTAFVRLPDSSEGKRTRVQSQDILLTITGANVGKVARVKHQIAEAYVSQHVALVRLYKPEFSPFIELCLKDIGSGRGALLDLAYGGGKPGLNLSNIRDLLLPLPPIEEQIEIVRLVGQLLAFADQLEAKVTSAQNRIDLLTQSVLTKAFKGKLVPQDLNDEPASVLLERIKAKRAVAPKAKRGSKIL
ncbi:restriction endonuclease subunit S [Pseudomonas monteilii]